MNFAPFAYRQQQVTTEPGPVTTDLLLNYDAGNTNSYPGSGTSWFNLQPTTFTSTLINGPTYSTDNGGTIVFDGTNDYVQKASIGTEFNFGTGDFTIECWVKLNGNSSTDGDGNRVAGLVSTYPSSGGITNTFTFLIKGDSTTTGTGLSYYCRDNVGTGSGFNYTEYNTTITQNVFHQVGIRHIAGVTHFFIDGVTYAASSDLTVNQSVTGRPFSLGTVNYGGYESYLNGTMGITRIYVGKGLTDEEVLQNYNANSDRI